MKLRLPDNGTELAIRRRKGERVVCVAVAVDDLACGLEWIAGDGTDWLGVTTDAPIGAYDFSPVAGLVCTVYGRAASRRVFAVADGLFRAGALEVWLDQPDGLWKMRRPADGMPVVAVAGPSTPGMVLSAARARVLVRAAA